MRRQRGRQNEQRRGRQNGRQRFLSALDGKRGSCRIFIFLLFCYTAAFVYASVQLNWWLRAAGASGPFRVIIVTALAGTGLVPVLGALLPESGIRSRLQAAGNVWLGFFMYFGSFLIVMHIGRGIYRLAGGRSAVQGQQAAALLTAAAAAALLITLAGYYSAHRVRTTHYSLNAAVGGDKEGLRIVLISDLHLGADSSRRQIKAMVDMVNAAEPDLVLVAGDIISDSFAALPEPAEYEKLLSGLSARCGVYGVYGNHDVEELRFAGFPITARSELYREKEFEDFCRRAGFEMLQDGWVSPDKGLILVGRIDREAPIGRRKSPENLISGVLSELAAAGGDTESDSENRGAGPLMMVLAHEPAELAELAAAGADFVFAGHTHRGQIFPGNLITPLFNDSVYGVSRYGEMQVVVTSGVGWYGPPMRLGTRSEIAVIDIGFQSRE